jgi:chemotaxis protein CheC
MQGTNTLDLAAWTRLARSGTDNALSGLSQMINQEIEVKNLEIEEVLPRNIANLIGKPDDQVIGVYLSFSGYSQGHIMLAFQPATAYELVDMAMGLPGGSTRDMGEMEKSVLGEVGNIVGAFFLNSVADGTNQTLLPSPPQIIIGQVRETMKSVMAEVMLMSEPIFGIRMAFATTEPAKEIQGSFLVLPTYE